MGEVGISDLLCEEDLLGGYFDAEVAARYHHAVGRLENLVEPLHSLVVLDLRDDLDVSALVAEHLPSK